MKINIQPIQAFLGCSTPLAWCEQAAANQNILLLDHAHCEKKAASTALMMLFRYPEHEDIVHHLSRIAREELRHFEKVISLLKKRNILFQHLPPARYAEGLRQLISTYEPARLIDILIMSAFIEARSCERFASIIPYLDSELGTFYKSLLEAEARHFELYLKLAKKYAEFDIAERINLFRQREVELILTQDTILRFHSGMPQVAA